MEQPTYAAARREAMHHLRVAREWLTVECDVTDEEAAARREAWALITRARALLAPPS